MHVKAIDYKNIPVQADVLSRILGLDVEATDCFRELDNLVHAEQGIAALVLRVVNSPFYSRGQRIVTIPMAINILGFNMVRSLSMLAFSRALFSQTRLPLFRRHVWEHSLLTGLAAREICTLQEFRREADEAFMAGLMHDIGKVLLFSHAPEQALLALQDVLESGCPAAEAEGRHLGIDHCQVGAEAVLQWNLPSHFATYMGCVHDSVHVIGSPVLQALVAADQLLQWNGIGGFSRALDAEAAEQLAMIGLDDGIAAQILSETFVPRLLANDAYQLCVSL